MEAFLLQASLPWIPAKAATAKVSSGRGASYTAEFAAVLQRVRALYQQLEQYDYSTLTVETRQP
jgi:hypothetical protein